MWIGSALVDAGQGVDHQLSTEGDLHLILRRCTSARGEHHRRQFVSVEDDLHSFPFTLQARQRGALDVTEFRTINLGRRHLLRRRRTAAHICRPGRGAARQPLVSVAAAR